MDGKPQGFLFHTHQPVETLTRDSLVRSVGPIGREKTIKCATSLDQKLETNPRKEEVRPTSFCDRNLSRKQNSGKGKGEVTDRRGKKTIKPDRRGKAGQLIFSFYANNSGRK